MTNVSKQNKTFFFIYIRRTRGNNYFANQEIVIEDYKRDVFM